MCACAETFQKKCEFLLNALVYGTQTAGRCKNGLVTRSPEVDYMSSGRGTAEKETIWCLAAVPRRRISLF